MYYSVFGVMAILHETTLFLLQVWRHFALKAVDHTPTGVIFWRQYCHPSTYWEDVMKHIKYKMPVGSAHFIRTIRTKKRPWYIRWYRNVFTFRFCLEDKRWVTRGCNRLWILLHLLCIKLEIKLQKNKNHFRDS